MDLKLLKFSLIFVCVSTTKPLNFLNVFSFSWKILQQTQGDKKTTNIGLYMHKKLRNRQRVFILRIKKLQNIIKCVHLLKIRFNISTRDAYSTKIFKFAYKTDHKRLGSLLI